MSSHPAETRTPQGKRNSPSTSTTPGSPPFSALSNGSTVTTDSIGRTSPGTSSGTDIVSSPSLSHGNDPKASNGDAGFITLANLAQDATNSIALMKKPEAEPQKFASPQTLREKLAEASKGKRKRQSETMDPTAKENSEETNTAGKPQNPNGTARKAADDAAAVSETALQRKLDRLIYWNCFLFLTNRLWEQVAKACFGRDLMTIRIRTNVRGTRSSTRSNLSRIRRSIG